MTLRESLNAFIQSLEPTAAEDRAVKAVYGPLLQRLMKPLQLNPAKQGFVAGSWGRSTAITPLHDIDLFCVLQTTSEANQQVHRPSQVLTRVETVLRDLKIPGARLKRQPRSIQISNVAQDFPALGFDIVPAFANPDHKDRYHIPDERKDDWIRTNPELHKTRLHEADKTAGQMLRPLIKAVKHWNRHHQHQLKSFYLETLSLNALPGRPRAQLEGLQAIFEGLASSVRGPVKDPAGLGPQLDQGKTTEEGRRRASLFLAAAAEVQAAMSNELAGRPEQAQRRMRELFGPVWPT